MQVTFLDILLVLLPALSGFLASSLFRVRQEDSERVPFRPPSWVFGVAWAVLYALIGVAWARSNRQSRLNNIPFALLNVLLVSWIVAQKYSDAAALAILVCSLASSIACSQVAAARFWLAPLTAWLVFALMISTSQMTIQARQ